VRRGAAAYRRRCGSETLPVDRQARMDQRERADRIEPALAAEPTDNTEASEPAEPIDRIEPAEPIDRIEPAEPIDRIEPLDPMLRMEPEDPSERDEPGEIRIATFWQAGGSARPWEPDLIAREDHTQSGKRERCSSQTSCIDMQTGQSLASSRWAARHCP
jgi:hypothetical protein